MNGSRYYAGRTGYTGESAPQAIVIHELVGMDANTYGVQLCSPLPKFLCGPADPITCAFPYSQNPKGVHFVVTQTSFTQFADLTATTLGIDYINGNWSGLTALMPITDVNGPFIHIAIDSGCDCADKLVTLLCCIGTELGVSLPIIAASDLQTDRPEIILNPQLQGQVDNCVASGGFTPPPSIFDLEDRVEDLEECCAQNTSDIITLQNDVSLLGGRVNVLEQKMVSVEAKLTDIYEKIAVIPALQQAILDLQTIVADILSRCCPATSAQEQCFQYQINNRSNEQLITPNQCVWLNLPTKVRDRDNASCQNGCCPPIVQPGPLWMANLANQENCPDCATWSLTATVRFRLAEWCVGKKAQLKLIACGNMYTIAETTITFTGMQSVTLNGAFVLPSGCTDVHLLVCVDDDKITTAKVVEFADFTGCCVS